jgi:hypothetical protein
MKKNPFRIGSIELIGNLNYILPLSFKLEFLTEIEGELWNQGSNS